LPPGEKYHPVVPKCLPTFVEFLSSRNLFLMTAKKKVSSATKSKTAKSKPATPKPPAKKAPAKKATTVASAKKKAGVTKTSSAKNSTPVKKSVSNKAKPVTSKAPAKKTPAKKVATDKKASASKTTKVGKEKKAPVKAPVKSKAKSPASRKDSAKQTPSKNNESQTISKVKEIVSKSLAKSLKEERKAESNSFSFDDVVGFLKSKKKEKPKRVSTKENSDTQVTKIEVEKEKKAGKIKKLNTASIDDILGFGGPIAGNSRPVRDATKVPKQWMPYYEALMALRTALKGSLGERTSETIGASARESGELSINSSDAGTETFDRDLALSMVANDQEALEEIEDAIDRIFAGTYGLCLETQKPINKNRLKAVPFTRFSVEGQNQFERGKIKERDFGAGSFATLADSTMGEEE
jgi:RNA polymerase-binding transcription factor DksA